MKYIIFILMLVCSLPVWAALTATNDYTISGKKTKWTITSNSGDTGIKCWNVYGYRYWLFKVDTTGTIQYDLRLSEKESPTSFESDDLPNAVNLTTDKSYINDINAPYACINIDSCTSCTVDIDFWGQSN